MLNESIDNAVTDNTHVADDLEFTFAARVSWLCDSSTRQVKRFLLTRQTQDWSNRVSLGNMEGYRQKFENIQTYFKPRFAEATKVGNEMIKTIEDNLKARKAEQAASK